MSSSKSIVDEGSAAAIEFPLFAEKGDVEDTVKNVVKKVGDWRTASTIKNATAPTSTRTMGEARLERNRACAKGGFQHGWRNGRSGAARRGAMSSMARSG